jgi:hypothetical protein
VADLDFSTRELRLVLTESLALADELASTSTDRRRSTADAELGLSSTVAHEAFTLTHPRAATPRSTRSLSATLAGDQRMPTRRTYDATRAPPRARPRSP